MALGGQTARGSETALVVLMFTSIGGTERDPRVRVDDPVGPRLLRWRDGRYAAGRIPRLHPAVRRKTEETGPGTYGFMIARLHYMDEVIRQEVAKGLDHLVILGAGFDTRAHRMREDLAGVQVFEVDHPATSRDKRARLKKAGRLASGDVTYVEVDFTHESLLERLYKHGHSDSARTLFVLSGVSMYLPGESVLELFSQVAAHSSPRTSLLFDYFFDDAMTNPDRYHGASQWIDAVTEIGEEPGYGIEMAEIGAVLESRGLRLVSQADMPELAGRYLRREDGTSLPKPYDFAAVAHASVGN
jgi:methyltransferase (TIGR00027 family)